MVTILGTNVLSEAARGAGMDPAVRRFVEGLQGDYVLTAISQFELQYGVALLPDGRRRQDLAAKVERLISRCTIWDFDSAAAQACARLRAEQRRVGRSLPAMDALIAATAKSRGARLATRNVADFEGLGIEVINPWTAQSD